MSTRAGEPSVGMIPLITGGLDSTGAAYLATAHLMLNQQKKEGDELARFFAEWGERRAGGGAS